MRTTLLYNKALCEFDKEQFKYCKSSRSRIHNHCPKVVADTPLIHQPFHLAHLSSMAILPIMRNEICDFPHSLESPLCQR
ncbi:hypothetical protein BCR39DRAFT_161617 [Naematelia encephala]|uniref:Uncharacterized protein n=1 Tax=Naematelia encephala TaxID=71784 RepID=A0A1Y2B4J5_9TREE|nr:hypothetical protein BCR39DRAFT_161617 [Naematelia encephala]